MLGRKSGKFGFSKRELEHFELILKALRDKISEKGLTIQDEVYPEGYLFANDYKIWIFDLAECPDWSFGVWLVEDNEKDNKKDDEKEKKYCMWLFAQHKKYIDKFKPFASALCVEENIWVSDLEGDGDIHYEIDEALQVVDFVKEQPYLAWYRDVHWTNFNLKYVSPEEAKKDFEEHEAERLKREQLEAELDAEETAWMKNYYDKTGYKYKITTDENYWPKHSVIIEDKDVEPGCYGMLDEKEKEEFDKILKKYENRGFYLHSTFDDSAWVVKELKK